MTKENDVIHLKIDAEGAEYAILSDLSGNDLRARVQKLWVEFHSCASDTKYGSRQDLENKFKELGLPIEGWMF